MKVGRELLLGEKEKLKESPSTKKMFLVSSNHDDSKVYMHDGAYSSEEKFNVNSHDTDQETIWINDIEILRFLLNYQEKEDSLFHNGKSSRAI